ncbi:MAG: CRISPR-associated protein Csm6 [Tissierellia bacterium]|nr:CRISPR-associated protein Csm6 [Tissierellia bacterium]
MSKKVLFSSVGGTDPIKYFRDGAMLHILRVYKPDAVYLYLSKHMYNYHNKDNRYVYCIEKLGELLNHSFEVHLVKRPELEEVQDFDYFYEDFNRVISNIINEYKDYLILLNVSSGTPAMKGALQTMAALSEFKMIPIQVTTPLRKINIHDQNLDDYDVEVNWELNEDNDENFENRCVESKGENQLAAIKKNVVAKHIDAYDYVAALNVSNDIRDFLGEDLFKLLKAANYRLQLNFSGINTELKNTSYDILPVKDYERKIILEYLLSLNIKVLKEEYADFIRATTPVIAELFELVLKRICNIDLDAYSTKRKSNNILIRRWSREKLSRNPDLLEILDEYFLGGIEERPLASYHMSVIIEVYCSDTKIKNTVRDLRNVEQRVRNLTAHEIVSVTDEWIKNETGYKSEEIINKLKYLANVSGMNISRELWGSYEKMNELIKSFL